ncbi:hypothetical protein [Acuticoccus sediminis]|uniref:hypothetical protein n=1 Tax=Acuticoccus sediminis TaxID=2184697 RepID=UPI0011B93693|nr:hypothetical protein [Acuticoccus sediminis]
MHLLSIDPASIKMGWARWRSPDEIRSGVETLGSSHDPMAERLNTAREFFLRKIQAFDDRGAPFDAIYVEDFDAEAWQRGGKSNAKTREALTKIQGMLEELGVATRTPVEFVAVGTWRKHFLGIGKVGRGKKAPNWKHLAVQRCRQLGWSPKDHNEAEALAILDYARHMKDRPFAASSGPLFAGRAA